MVKVIPEENLTNLSLGTLHYRCSEESERFFKRRSHDPRYCFELFRRAILEQNQQSWELIYRQYQPLVSGWIERHSSFQSTGEEKDYFVNRAFEKMWQVMTPEKFNQFSDLKSVLRYMQMCINSVIMDHNRKKEETVLWDDAPKSILHKTDQTENVERRIMISEQQQALWQSLNQRLKNEKEQKVIYGMFVLALKPREILTEFKGVFKNANEIYQIRANVIDRLRRDQEFREYFSNF